VLGTAPGHGALVARSLDRGRTRALTAAPAVPLGRLGQGTSPAIWGIRFATLRHGFVFGRGLWETTDGGLHWTAASIPD
jgi:photosystem II stability/assembly factor-like uncharacterized protein